MTVLVSLVAQADFSYLADEPRTLAEAWGEARVWEPRLLASGGFQGLGMDATAMPPALGASSSAFAKAFTGARRGNPFLEMVVAAPKSVSLLAAFGSPRGRNQVVEAHRAAVAGLHAMLAKELLWARFRTPEGRFYRRAPELEAAEFVHFLSRRLDPHVHSHLVLPNVALGDDGKSRAIDALTLKFAASHLDLHYLAALEKGLEDRGLSGDGGADRLQAWAQDLADSREFSRRHDDVVREVNSSGVASRIASVRTRPPKPALANLNDVARGWSGRAASTPSDTTERVRPPLLDKEIVALRSRLAAEARRRGGGILDAMLGDRGLTLQGLSGRVDYGTVVLDDELRGRVGEAGYGSPPPRQRTYGRKDLERLASLLGQVRTGSSCAPGGVFKLAQGPGELVALESAARCVGQRGSVIVGCAADEALQWRSLGKPVAASVIRLSPGEKSPHGAAMIFSHLRGPADVASLIERGAGVGGLLVVDAARLDPLSGAPVGRGAGWRSWLFQQVEGEFRRYRSPALPAAELPPVALGGRVVLYESSEALRLGLAARSAAGEDLLVADERLASPGVRVVGAGGSSGAGSAGGSHGRGRPEAELCSADSLAQAASLRNGEPVYLMAPPVAPPATAVDARLTHQVLDLVGLRLPAYAQGHWAAARDRVASGREELGCVELRDENLAFLARHERTTEFKDGRAGAPWRDRAGDALARLLLSPLSIPGLDEAEGVKEPVSERLLSLLNLMETTQDLPFKGGPGRDPGTWLTERARTLVACERQRRIEEEVAPERAPGRLGRFRADEPPQRLLELARDSGLGLS
ncbi:MAG: relaxase domain-containing protein [Actinomycetota bacterium]|nr:relaxase domain-containing protein [Actinomycetota bacterium]